GAYWHDSGRQPSQRNSSGASVGTGTGSSNSSASGDAGGAGNVKLLRCPVINCNKRFSLKSRLQLHLRVGHTVYEIEKTFPPHSGDGLACAWIGAPTLHPPFSPPRGLPPISHCPTHDRLKDYCKTCQEVIRGAHEGTLPLPPARFYDRAQVELATPEGASIRVDLTIDNVETSAILHPEDEGGHGAVIVRILGLLEDGAHCGWIASQRLLPYNAVKHCFARMRQQEEEKQELDEPQQTAEAEAEAKAEPGQDCKQGVKGKHHHHRDIDKKNELFLSAKVEYLQLARFSGLQSTLISTHMEYKEKARLKELPHGAKFTR
ncbi:unnamed protein product, partial [Chrysoparadoxa australica]